MFMFLAFGLPHHEYINPQALHCLGSMLVGGKPHGDHIMPRVLTCQC